MIVCPICENQQAQGTLCDVCGRQLAAAPVLNLVTERMPELETTGVAPAANVVIERIPDLAPHRAEDIAVPAEHVPELEPTALAPAAAAPVLAPIPELEPTRAVDTDPRTVLPAVRTCRYCGSTQAQGLLCERCGNRLPVLRPRRQEASLNESVCSECGVPGAAGSRCRGCGAVVRQREDT